MRNNFFLHAKILLHHGNIECYYEKKGKNYRLIEFFCSAVDKSRRVSIKIFNNALIFHRKDRKEHTRGRGVEHISSNLY